jgi:hypothetical protein
MTMRLATLATALLLSACMSAPQPTSQDDGPQEPASPAQLQRLEAEARALAKADGCQNAAQCRTAPLGSRPCGGPREYLVYCATGTDSAALFRKLEQLRQAEEALNRERGLMSTCEFRTPPGVTLQGSTCQAAPGPEIR